MVIIQRPDPDQLLKHVQAEESAAVRGHLKIFFGASAGVGKTFTMLEAARQRKKEGWDVVVGIVETHNRAETAALLEGLTILPRKEIVYKGVTLQEFDLDAALTRRPRLVLVDELAHTNAPGARHVKRWQDVEELLDGGIDVYTTLNVQHWESLNDVVAQITGTQVRETVPDTFLERTYDLELVDLPPEELLTRLKEGKVYRGDLAKHAAENFFQPGNLIALRELALRHTAERVDAQMQAFKTEHAIAATWPVGERLLVGVSANPRSPRLIRATARLAARLHAAWIALHVETAAHLALPPEARAHVAENLRLAESLGAEAVSITGEDVVEEALAFARTRNVTKIVLGQPAKSRWTERIFGSIVDNLARKCGDIDLYVISGINAPVPERNFPTIRRRVRWAGVGWGLLATAACTLLAWPLLDRVDAANLAMVFLLGIAWTAYWFGQIPALTTAAVSVLAFDFFFIPPFFTFRLADPQYFLTFGVLLSVGILVGAITSRLRQQTEEMQKREQRTRMLYTFGRELLKTPNAKQLVQRVAERLRIFYKLPIVIITPGSESLEVTGGDAALFEFDAREQGVAQWVFDHGQLAGAGTDTLAGAHGLYVPLQGSRSTIGVLGIRPSDHQLFQDPEQLQLVETLAAEISGALESRRMSESIGRAEMQMEMLALQSRPAEQQAPVHLIDFFPERRVVVLPQGLSDEDCIKQLVETLDLPHPMQALRSILEREKIGPTVLHHGIAIPHARLPGIRGIQAAFGLAPEGPTRVWIVFVGPTEDPQLHLTFLAAVASFFQKEQHLQAIQQLKSSQDILAYIRQQE